MIDLSTESKEIIARYPPGRARSALLPLLHLAQERDGHVSRTAMDEIAALVGITAAEIRAVATFYSMLHLEPKGKRVVSVCHNLACSLSGAERVIEAIESDEGVSFGETSSDGEFTFERAECLAVCDAAPVIQVDYDRVHGPVTLESALELLRRLRSVSQEPPLLVDSIPLTEKERGLLGEDPA